MLQSLYIRNFAIISEVKLDFSQNLNIITGETGAGKSILLDALELVLGGRFDAKFNSLEGQNTVVEAQFQLSSIPEGFEEFIESENLIILRRIISNAGKSRAFLNDIPTTLGKLKQLSSHLIDVHKQFDSSWLFHQTSQLSILDSLAETKEDAKRYLKEYDLFQDDKKTLKELLVSRENALKEKDYVQFQLNELNEAELDEIDFEELNSRVEKLSNTDQIREILSEIILKLNNEESGLIDLVRSSQHSLESLPYSDSQTERWQATLHSIFADLDSLESELTSSLDSIESDPMEQENLTAKLDQIQRLLFKHSFSDISELIALRTRLNETFQDLDSIEERINELEKKISSRSDELWKIAKKLHIERQNVSSSFSDRVSAKLSRLSMKDAIFQVQLDEKADLSPHGISNSSFLFTANQGQQLRPINEVASGGERSRLALCIKSTVAGRLVMPTLVFDEIDSGISGDVALKMSGILAEMTQEHQVICITHSPQIAAANATHFYIFKENIDSRSSSNTRILTFEERIMELAKMLSSDPPSSAAIKNAEGLLRSSLSQV